MLFVARPAWIVPALALMLAGCVDNIPDVAVARGDVRNAIAKGTMASPRPATVALASLEGAPAALADRYRAVFDRAAADREITVTDAKAARYLVRGYLSAYPSESGTDLAYVYDIFDANQRRVERVNDVLTVPDHAADAWALLDDKTMASLAGRSADDLAVALAGMPEARQSLAEAAGSTARTAN
ncbi:hypothetical protein [Lichenifustis flavocetrariae]|uniref:DUF2059 domain-containing protein n=1 Tax=Lichenifustis flavocetrariae TaxID=2949735 RepID=A0AA42CPA0_9HYPH|nr:hypothetical protein [Lichenifustis flavocetrariae]MCW6510217.1 hypothetical protein [Lichenifustis flavocetrariae]